MESLRIYLNIHNEVVVRCYNCGLAGTAPKLLRNQTTLTWIKIAETRQENRVFGDEAVPAEWIDRAKQ